MEEYINNKTIIENEIFLAFKDNVICSLCKNILIFPIICMKCHKVYCKKCIDDWNKNNQEYPNGCKEYDYQECLGKNEILSKLKFKCLGCGEKIFYNEVIRHYESGCPEKISLQNSEKESHDIQIDNSSHESETENSSQESKIENLVSNQNKILKESNNNFYFLYSNYFWSFWCWKINFNRNVSKLNN